MNSGLINKQGTYSEKYCAYLKIRDIVDHIENMSCTEAYVCTYGGQCTVCMVIFTIL
jgi:hypothetical protein